MTNRRGSKDDDERYGTSEKWMVEMEYGIHLGG